jgi:hypothetical protein
MSSNYVLVYAWDGHEIAYHADSLDQVNAEIRKLYDEHGKVAILRIEEDQPPARPRTWSAPAAPDAKRLIGKQTGMIWKARVSESGKTFWSNGGITLSWSELLDSEQEVTEEPETELEAAVRRLREYGLGSPGSTGWAPQAYQDNADDIRIVLRHALNGGTI